MLQDIRQALAEVDDKSRAAILRAFGKSFRALQPEIEAFLTRIERARALGVQITLEWLELHIQIQLADFGQAAAIIISQAQNDASGLAKDDFQVYADILGAETTAPAVELVTTGVMGNGSSLAAAFQELGPKIGIAVRAGIGAAITEQAVSAVIGQVIKETVACAATSALRLATTETMRIYRETALADFKQNKMLVRGWGWISRLAPNTCIMCILMHGTIHPLSEPFKSHVQCQCIPVPRAIITTFEDFQSGREWFLDKSGAAQEQILGKAAYKAYASGEVKLDDFIARTRSAEWGPGQHVQSLKKILGAREAARFYEKAS